MRIATLLISILILVALLMPGNDLPGIKVGNWDKAIHFVMFLTWSVALRYDCRKAPLPFWRAVIIGILFALATETLQTQVEGRGFDVYDIAADIAGVAAGWKIAPLIILPIEHLLQRFKQPNRP